MHKNKMHFPSILLGALLATWACIFIYSFAIKDSLKNATTVDSEDSTEASTTENTSNVETKQYNTAITNWELPLENGPVVKFKTPENFYSLSDQYLENLTKSYSIPEVTSDDMIVVGDNSEATKCGTVINACTFSGLKDILKQVYGDEYNEETMLEAEAYTYMKTGKLPEELPLNYTIKELATFVKDDITYKAYEVNYDTEYEAPSEDTESTETSTETIHTTQVSCYSDTEDAIEIVLYQSEYDSKKALDVLGEFIGTEPTLTEETNTEE